MDLKVDVQGLEAWIARFKGADKIVSDETGKAGQRGGLIVEGVAKGKAKVWRGQLRRSITTKTTTTAMYTTTTVGTNVPYAKARNYGRPSDAPMPPPGALLPWMAAKGIAATTEDIKGTRRVRDDKGNITGSIISGRGFVGPRRGYLPIEYLIARAIKRNSKGDKFLTGAFEDSKAKIRAEFQKVPAAVIARLKGGG